MTLVPLAISRLVRKEQKRGHFVEAAWLMVWLFTARALVSPELRILGREMWADLSRGFDCFDEVTAEFQQYLGVEELPEWLEEEAKRIPAGLEPR